MSEPEYLGKTHRQAFEAFNERMNMLRREDLSKFFGEVVPTGRSQEVEETARRVQEMLGLKGDLPAGSGN